MLKTPLTKDRIRHHFQYGWWKYALSMACIFFVINLVFTMTQYRSPDWLKVDLYVSASGANQEALQAYLEKSREVILPDMEEVNALTMMTNDGSDPYTTMQLSTYIMAGEGDIYLLSQSDFKSYAAQGAMVNLDPYIASGELNTGAIDLLPGTVSYKEDETSPTATHVFGIPADDLYGWREFSVDNKGLVLCVMAAGGNIPNSIKLVDYMLQTLHIPMP